MPELPEVESVRVGLAPLVDGRTIEQVSVLHPRPVRRHVLGPDHFSQTLVGRQLTMPRRRGKYLWLSLADGDAIVSHLGMSGQFRSDQPSAPLQRHARVVFDLDNGQQLRFVDQRMFGGMWLSEGGADLPEEISHIALDPLDPAFDPDAVVARIRASRSGIKRLLLNQEIVSGVGNIYADEALWRSRQHFDTPGDQLSARQVRKLLDEVTAVMTQALAAGGTSFDALYVNVNGESGYFSRSLDAYGREGEPCGRCGTAIVREAFANRSSYRCPRCQPVAHRLTPL